HRLESLKSLSAECKFTQWSSRNPEKIPLTLRTETTKVRFMRPNLIRLERSLNYNERGESGWHRVPNFQTIAINRETEWRIHGFSREYERWAADPAKPGIGVPTASLLDGFFSSEESQVNRVRAFKKEHLLISLTLEPHQVIHFVHGDVGSEATWDEHLTIGKDGLIHRIEAVKSDRTVHRLSVLTQVSLNPKFKPESFAYQPPASFHPYVYKDLPARTLPIGSIAPDFTIQTQDGKPLRFADYRGKVVVLDFWATWCGPCMQAFPHTSSIARKYRDKGVVVLAVDVGDPVDLFKAWIPRHPELAVIFAIDPAGIKGKGIDTRLYKVSGIPTQYVIGADGKIVAALVGYDGDGGAALEKAVQKACGV
ncbi:MAG TPA: TlpA disulfide reductase family protein, partial [Fimbriimonas sp.]|nr:TlpA disulfide reductase family protein [Fimbriimonas sp.]